MMQTPQGMQRFVPAVAQQSPPQTYPPPQSFPQQQAPAQSAAPMAGPAQPVQQNPQQSEQPGEDEPIDYTPQDVAEHIASMAPADASKWLQSVLGNLPLEVAQTLMPNVLPMAKKEA